MDIVCGIDISINRNLVPTLFKTQMRALDTCERFESRAGCTPALRTMAVEGVAECIGDAIAHGAAEALASQRCSAIVSRR
ncbi:hypothetical protein [Paraburkholderia sp. Ac-20340]|uniref:hypothetical protein n=1 Tax=Paraburkholderia sp. Ac-20340 TaxID=2703888 RepID=UPI003216C2F1